MSWRFIEDEEMPQEMMIQKEVPKEIFLPIEGDELLEIKWMIHPLEGLIEVKPDPRYVVITIPKETTASFFYLSYSIENDANKGSITLQVEEEDFPIVEKEKREVSFLGSDSRDMESGTSLEYKIPIPSGGEVRFTCDKEELIPFLGISEKGITISPPLTCQGIFEISYEVMDSTGGLDVNGHLILRVQSKGKPVSKDPTLETSFSQRISPPLEEELTQMDPPKAKLLEPTIPPLEGDYEVAVFFKGQELYEKRLSLVENKSIIIGKQTSKMLSPTMDLRQVLTDTGKRRCSRRQLKILIHQKRIYLSNIGNHPVQMGIQTVQPNQENLWDPDLEVVIAGEVSLQLRRRRE